MSAAPVAATNVPAKLLGELQKAIESVVQAHEPNIASTAIAPAEDATRKAPAPVTGTAVIDPKAKGVAVQFAQDEKPKPRALNQPIVRAAAFMPTTLDETSREVDLVATTEAPVRRWDWDGPYAEVLDMRGANLSRVTSGTCPLLHDHWMGTEYQVGVVTSARIEGDKLIARVRFGGHEKGEEYFRRVAEGSLRGVSIGYGINGFETEESTNGGRTIRATDWTLYEVSLVAVPADAQGSVRSAAITQEPVMTDKSTAAPAANPPAPPVDESKVRAEAIQAERVRVAAIDAVASKFKIEGVAELKAKAIAEGLSVADFREKVLDLIASDAEKGGKTQRRTDPVASPAVLPQQVKTTAPLGRYVLTVARAKKDGVRPFDVAEREGNTDLMRALTASSMSGGGFLVPTNYVEEMIELLRSKSVVRMAGARVLPMPGGNLDIPKQLSAGTAYYVGESQNVTPSQQTGGRLLLSAKKLVALTPISNDLIRFSSPQADEMVRDDLIKVLALREDLAFLRGDGLSGTPKGIRNYVASGQVVAQTASATVANVTADLSAAINRVESANVAFTTESAVWLMPPKAKNFIGTLRLSATGDGPYAFPEILGAQPRLMGYRVFTSTQIPTNLGGSGNYSEYTFVNMPDVIIGDAMRSEITVADGAAYYDGSAVQSGLSRDETVIKAQSEHDCGMRYDVAASIISNGTWGN